MAIGTVVSIALTYVPFTALIDDLREPYNTHILPSAIVMLALAMWKLSRSTSTVGGVKSDVPDTSTMNAIGSIP